MARTNHVDAYRGQRKCQFTPEADTANLWPSKCGERKAVHPKGVHPGHEFTQTALTCNSCGEPIEIGTAYKWVAPRAHKQARGVKKNRHETCPAWRPSELTSSPVLSLIYGAEEAADDDHGRLDTPTTSEGAESYLDDLRAIADAMAEAVREAGAMRLESSEAIEEGFGHSTYQSEELAEQADALDGWADELESITFDEFYAEEVDEAEEVEEDEEEDTSELESEIETWADAQRDTLFETLGANPV